MDGINLVEQQGKRCALLLFRRLEEANAEKIAASRLKVELETKIHSLE